MPFLQYATTRGLYHHLRKYVSKQSGLARLLTLRLAADAGLSPRLLCEVCGQGGDQALRQACHHACCRVGARRQARHHAHSVQRGADTGLSPRLLREARVCKGGGKAGAGP